MDLIGKHRGKALILVLLLGAGIFFWLKSTEKSESVLFNQLIAIMEENVPTSSTSYTRNLTEVVCPLVSPEKLTEMMEDGYASVRTRYLDTPGLLDRAGDNSWAIKNGVLKLIITSNIPDGDCTAIVYKDAGL